MDDLTRFVLAWAGLLALVVSTPPLARWMLAHMVARAFRHLCRFDRHVL